MRPPSGSPAGPTTGARARSPSSTAALESDPASVWGHIVPGTGTGGFAGWSGPALIRHDDQGAYFEITLA